MSESTAINLDQVRSLPAHTITATLRSPRGTSTRTFKGALLYDYARATGMTPEAPSLGFGNYYFVAQSDDGFLVTIAYYEVTPRATEKQVLLAYEQDGEALRMGIRLIVPGDDLGGRSVMGISQLEFKHTPHAEDATEHTQTLNLGGLLERPRSLTLQDLAQFETHTALTKPSPRRGGISAPGRNFSGVLLWDVLEAAGPVVDPNVNEDIMRKIVMARSADGNTAAIAPGEIDPRFMGGKIIIATHLEGEPLAEKDGPFRLIAPFDKAVGRSLKALQAIELRDA
jgi:DMSO/TMAO reductase YedYZ molybdopterin-dependent catalytic subunit